MTDYIKKTDEVSQKIRDANSKDECKHNDKEYQAYEPDTNVQEDYRCLNCGKQFDIPEPDEDTMRGEDR
tara:strand:+ start:1259 stop:1465 length:207 start_codon:yes stop_codon:yes gene_type:complete